MVELNWRKPEDYKYLKKLDDKGWAWEFIRRSPSYLAVYEEIMALPKKSRSAKTHYYPDRLPTDKTEGAWKMRVDEELGVVAQKVTQGDYWARSKRSLVAMYPPDQKYQPDVIEFLNINPYPVFYADPAHLPKDVKRSHERMLRRLRHPSDLHNDAALSLPSSIIVLFDMERGMDEQIRKFEVFLKAYAKTHKARRNDTALHRNKWASYIRILDALNSDEKISLTDIVRVVDKQVESDHSGSHAYSKAVSSLKKSAVKMSEDGFRGLIFNIQRT